MTFDPATVEAVVFDLGGVFLYPHYRPVQQVLESEALTPPSDLALYQRAHHAGCLALAQADGEVREHRQDFWLTYDTAYAVSLGVPDRHHVQIRSAIRATWDWRHDDNIAALHRLIGSGMPTAIVSNNNGTAPEQLRRNGICQVGEGPLPRVSAIIDSSLVGVAKPDPMIMAPALHALGVAPERALYVGDTVKADVAGALAAGMQVVQLDPFDHHADYGHARAVDVATVIAQL